MSKKNLALLLLGNTVLFIGVYFLLVQLDFWLITPIYIAIGTVLAVIFIVYNRGFYAKNAKLEELPNTMTHKEKLAYIQDGKDRLARTRWMITLLLPIVLAIAADIVYLYIFPYLKEILL